MGEAWEQGYANIVSTCSTQDCHISTLQDSTWLVLLQSVEPHFVPEVSHVRSEGGEGGWVHGQHVQTGKQPADTLGPTEGRHLYR